MTVPALQTERLILREYRLEDFPQHSTIWADPRTRRHFSSPFNEEDVWMRFLRNFGQWALFGYGFWAVEDKASTRYIGAVGFFQAKRPMNLPYRDAPEAGWVIAPDFSGKRVASEAVAAALAWADRHIAAAETWCMIAPENINSQKIARTTGYRPALAVNYKGEAMLTFRRPREMA